MMRLDSTDGLPHQAQEIAEDLQPDVARFLRVELHAGDVSALDDGRERLAVLGDGDGVAGDRRHEAVREVHLRRRSATPSTIDASRCIVERVPADVRNLDALGVAAQPVALARRAGPGPGSSGASSLPSNSHCMPRQMPSSGRPSPTRARIASVQSGVERARRAEVADARHDDRRRVAELGRRWRA